MILLVVLQSSRFESAKNRLSMPKIISPLSDAPPPPRTASDLCQFYDCLRRATYGNNRIRSHCKSHGEDLFMVKIWKQRECEVEGCRTQPNFGFEGDKSPTRCVKHKENGMLNIKSR